MHILSQNEEEIIPFWDGTTFSFKETDGLICFLCNERALTLDSYPFHLKSCMRRWELAELQKPVGQRRKAPRPLAPLPTSMQDRTSVERFNAAASLVSGTCFFRAPFCGMITY